MENGGWKKGGKKEKKEKKEEKRERKQKTTVLSLSDGKRIPEIRPTAGPTRGPAGSLTSAYRIVITTF
jgi:hypothetical protein